MIENSKFKIAVVGIGGVGGYVGGKLAARFENSEDVEIVLAARGANEKAIRADGLKLVTTQGEQVVHPQLAKAAEIRDADLILLCTKAYDLEETIAEFKGAVSERTSILPLLNGVEPSERIAQILPTADVWQGCIYVVAKLAEPGVIKDSGGIGIIYFGKEGEANDKLKRVETLLSEAGIDARLSDEITARTWDKFVFISSLAAATTYLNARTREVVDDENHKKLLYELLGEVKKVAAAKNIHISETAVQESFDKLNNLPPEATSSMHTDSLKGNRTEVESLVGYVVREAKKLDVSTPVYEKVYEALKRKLAGG